MTKKHKLNRELPYRTRQNYIGDMLAHSRSGWSTTMRRALKGIDAGEDIRMQDLVRRYRSE